MCNKVVQRRTEEGQCSRVRAISTRSAQCAVLRNLSSPLGRKAYSYGFAQECHSAEIGGACQRRSPCSHFLSAHPIDSPTLLQGNRQGEYRIGLHLRPTILRCVGDTGCYDPIEATTSNQMGGI